jgi:hypothetical protein
MSFTVLLVAPEGILPPRASFLHSAPFIRQTSCICRLSLEEIESQLSALTILKSQKLAEAETKKSKKDKKNEKSGKLDVKVPKVHSLHVWLS